MKTATAKYPDVRSAVRRVGYKDGAAKKKEFKGKGAPKADLGADGDGYTDEDDAAHTWTKTAGAWTKKKVEDDSTEITSDALTASIGTAVTTALKTLIPTDLASKLEGLVKKEDLDAAVKAALASNNVDSKSVTKAQLDAVVSEVLTKAVDGIKRDKKNIFNAGDKNGGDGTGNDNTRQTLDITVPCSWRKGNLPLYGKQLLNVLLRKNMNEGIDAKDIARGEALGDSRLTKMIRSGEMGKAITSTQAGAVDEFVPTDLSSELQRRLYLNTDLGALFAQAEIEMPSQPYEMPLAKTRPTFYLNASENTATTASDPGTGKITFNAPKFMGQTDSSYEADEDSIIPLLSYITGELGLAGAEAWERAILNGDTTGTHMDSDTAGVTNDAAKGFKGLRKLALAITELKVSLASGGITDANLRSLKKALGKWGVNPKNLVLVVGTNGQNDLEGLPEVTTVDKFGGNATIITGALPRWRNIPIVTSSFCREDLNASGVYDGSTVTKGSVLLFNIKEFMTGRRRDFTIETWRDVKAQTNVIVASYRKAFVPRETPSATIKSVAIGYNYTA